MAAKLWQQLHGQSKVTSLENRFDFLHRPSNFCTSSFEHFIICFSSLPAQPALSCAFPASSGVSQFRLTWFSAPCFIMLFATALRLSLLPFSLHSLCLVSLSFSFPTFPFLCSIKFSFSPQFVSLAIMLAEDSFLRLSLPFLASFFFVSLFPAFHLLASVFFASLVLFDALFCIPCPYPVFVSIEFCWLRFPLLWSKALLMVSGGLTSWSRFFAWLHSTLLCFALTSDLLFEAFCLVNFLWRNWLLLLPLGFSLCLYLYVSLCLHLSTAHLCELTKPPFSLHCIASDILDPLCSIFLRFVLLKRFWLWFA